jgi:hypothetical protein
MGIIINQGRYLAGFNKMMDVKVFSIINCFIYSFSQQILIGHTHSAFFQRLGLAVRIKLSWGRDEGLNWFS